jgi:TRAP-type mannitol/chloroaromatic compound transport system permease small subunit
LRLLLSVSRAIDAVNLRLGKWLAWLILAAILISAANAVVRKTLDTSSNSWLELQWYLFSIVFLMCASWTLLANEHIRIDIVNSYFPKRVRDWIDIVGHVLFLTPFCLIMIWTGWPFFFASLRVNEISTNAGGLLVWPIKLLVPVAFMFLLAQGISELIKRVAILRGLIPDQHDHSHHPAVADVKDRIPLADQK